MFKVDFTIVLYIIFFNKDFKILIMYRQTHFRTFLKTISWRIVATLATMILVYIFTSEIAIAFTIGAFEVVAKMALYYIHERVWDKFQVGREK